MDEKTLQTDESGKEEVSKTTTESQGDGLSIVQRAEQAAARAEAAANALKAENDRLERLKANAILGGQTEAGMGQEPKKEETADETRRRIEKEISEGKFDNLKIFS